MEQTGILNQGGGKIEYVDPSKITAGQKYKTGLVFIYPATPNAIDDIDALFTGWIVFNENVNRWQEAGQEALKGNWDASSGNLPSTNIIAGDKYIISVAGTVNGIHLNENDTITAKIDNATDSQTGGVFDDWTVVGAITVTSVNVNRPNGDSVEDSFQKITHYEFGLIAPQSSFNINHNKNAYITSIKFSVNGNSEYNGIINNYTETNLNTVSFSTNNPLPAGAKVKIQFNL